VCQGCGTSFPQLDPAYADLRPARAFSEQTKYLDDALHADARQSSVAPPVLSAGIRNDVLREFLDLGPDDRVIDLGCGSGRALLWNADRGAYGVGLDVSPYFAAQSRDRVDLVLGDLRRLPLSDGSFTKAYALDVLEHLSRDSLEAMLAEASRVLAPGGRLFVYSHVRKNARLAVGLRAINRVAGVLDRAGLIDLSQERLRKSDHVNPLADLADLRSTVARAGFRIERIRYYTPLIGGVVENILLRLAERAVTLAMRRRAGAEASVKEARAAGKRVVARHGMVYRSLRVLTSVMKLDLRLFGSIESGPFFALLVKQDPAAR
jgi:SAM-dependent methyltransferase